MEHVLVCSQQRVQSLEHSRVEDLVYIYTNSRFLWHCRGPKPAQWYRLNEVHSDDDLDGEDDDNVELDRNDRGDIVDDDGIDNINFNLDDIDLENHDSDDDDVNDYDGDGNLNVFDFDEGNVLRHNKARYEDHEGSIGRPSSTSLFGRQGPRLDHNVIVEGIENVRNKVDSSQPQSDSLSFGQANEGDDAVRANDALHVQNEQRRTEVHLESTNVSFELNHLMGFKTPNAVEATIALVDTIHGSASTSGLNLQSGPQCRPVTQSIANTSRLDVSRTIGVGATLVGMRNVSGNVGQGAPSHQSFCRALVENIPSVIPSKVTSVPLVQSQRTTRGLKRLKRYQGTSLPFSIEDYDKDDGRPRLDKNGIRDAKGSHRTKKLVLTRDDNLRLKSVTLQTDDDLSTDDSEEDPRYVETNDPTLRIRT